MFPWLTPHLVAFRWTAVDSCCVSPGLCSWLGLRSSSRSTACGKEAFPVCRCSARYLTEVWNLSSLASASWTTPQRMDCVGITGKPHHTYILNMTKWPLFYYLSDKYFKIHLFHWTIWGTWSSCKLICLSLFLFILLLMILVRDAGHECKWCSS